MVSYRSVKAKFVGVWSSHVATTEVNSSFVLVDAIDAQNISQSAVMIKSASAVTVVQMIMLTLGVCMPCVQWHTVLVEHGRVEIALHVVYCLWDQL